MSEVKAVKKTKKTKAKKKATKKKKGVQHNDNFLPGNQLAVGKGRPALTEEEKAAKKAGKTACIKHLYHYTCNPKATPYKDSKDDKLSMLQKGMAAFSIRLAMYGDTKDLDFVFGVFGQSTKASEQKHTADDSYINFLDLIAGTDTEENE